MEEGEHIISRIFPGSDDVKTKGPVVPLHDGPGSQLPRIAKILDALNL